MKKFLKYYKNIIRVKFMQFMEYRGDFVMTTLASFSYNFLAIIFINMLFDNFDKVGNWGRYEGLFLLGYCQLVFYIYAVFFGALDDFSDLIREGKLDQFLLRPVNAFLAIVLDNPAIISMLSSVVLAIAIMIVAISNSTYSVLMLIFALLLMPISVLLFTAFRAANVFVSFWVTDITPLNQFGGQMIDNMKFPLGIYPRGLQLIFKTLVPVSLSTYVPASIVYFGFDLNLFVYFIGCTVFFSWLTWYLWSRGLKSYSSASS